MVCRGEAGRDEELERQATGTDGARKALARLQPVRAHKAGAMVLIARPTLYSVQSPGGRC